MGTPHGLSIWGVHEKFEELTIPVCVKGTPPPKNWEISRCLRLGIRPFRLLARGQVFGKKVVTSFQYCVTSCPSKNKRRLVGNFVIGRAAKCTAVESCYCFSAMLQ